MRPFALGGRSQVLAGGLVDMPAESRAEIVGFFVPPLGHTMRLVAS